MTVTFPEVTLADETIDSPLGPMLIPGSVIPARTIELDPDEISQLLQEARKAAASAYAPFSGLHVGAAVRMADDPDARTFAGSNIENSSLGATSCAERTAIFSAVALGLRRIRILALAVTAKNGEDSSLPERSPCGICRQVIREFADGHTLIAIDNPEAGRLCDLLDIERILPWGFRLGRNEAQQDESPFSGPGKTDPS